MKVVPYFYTWSQPGTIGQPYQTPTLVSAYQQAGLKLANLAFESVVNGTYSTDVPSIMEDITEFKKMGGNVAVSFGGSGGNGIQPTFAILDSLTQSTGIQYYDFDIEGANELNDTQNIALAEAMIEYKAKYPDCYFGLTLPVMPSGLDDDGLHCLDIFATRNAPVNAVNIMTMDYGAGNMDGKTHYQCAVSAIEGLYGQLKLNWPALASYSNIAVTPMIGQNDDGTIFTQEDATNLGNYARSQGLFQISYWAFQRDQVGTGSLGVYSQVNTSNFEFFKAFQ